MTWKLLFRGMIVCVLVCGASVVAALRIGEATPPGWAFTYASNPDDGLWRVYSYDIERNLHMPLRVDAVLRSLPLVSPDRRLVVWREVPQSYLLNRETGERHVLDGSVLPLAWSPDSTHFAYTDQTDDLYVMSLTSDGTPDDIYLIPAPDDQSQAFPMWSPDGSRLAFLAFNTLTAQIYVTGVNTLTETTRVTVDRTGHHRAMAWSPTGEEIAYLVQPVGAQTLSLYIADVDGTNHRLIRDDVNNGADGLAWSPDGEHIAYRVNHNEGLYVVNLTTGERTGRLDAGLNAGRVRWSPDSHRLVFLSLTNSDFYIVDTSGFYIERLTDNDNFNVFMP